MSGPDDNGIKVFARIRPCAKELTLEWNDKTLANVGYMQHRKDRTLTEYEFTQVFDPTRSNTDVFDTMVKPLTTRVRNGYNALVVAYGQTNAGKTHSLLGKPDRGIQGIIALALMHFLKDPNVLKVRLKTFEAFGQRTTKIPIYDLLDPLNETEAWDEKVGKTTYNFTNTTSRVITSNIEAIEAVRFAQKNSHYAPTGKNAESSRGHVVFVVDILSKGESGSATADITTRMASLVFCDLAGSEGETALGPEFKQAVGLEIYDQRRMEAGVINMGLSDLQMFFQELKNKGKVGEVDGQGLRNILKQYVDDDSNYVSVLFCVSPDPQNANSTESTLKFAEKVCQIKVKPKQCKSRTNWKKLALRIKHENEKLQRDIEQLKAQLKPDKRKRRSSSVFRPVIRTIATFADLKSELVLGQNIKSTDRTLKVQQGIGTDIPCEQRLVNQAVPGITIPCEQRLINQAVPGITIPCSRGELEEFREGIQEDYFTTPYGPALTSEIVHVDHHPSSVKMLAPRSCSSLAELPGVNSLSSENLIDQSVPGVSIPSLLGVDVPTLFEEFDEYIVEAAVHAALNIVEGENKISKDAKLINDKQQTEGITPQEKENDPDNLMLSNPPETCNDGGGKNPKSEVATDKGDYDLAPTSDYESGGRPRCHSLYFLDEFDERHFRDHRRTTTRRKRYRTIDFDEMHPMIPDNIYEKEFGERLRKEGRARRHTAKTRRSHVSRHAKAGLKNSKKRAGPQPLSRLNCGFFMV